MEMQEKFTVSLTEQSVKEIIAWYLSEKGYNAKPENVFFDVLHVFEGYGMAEHEVTRFKGCRVEMDGTPWAKG